MKDQLAEGPDGSVGKGMTGMPTQAGESRDNQQQRHGHPGLCREQAAAELHRLGAALRARSAEVIDEVMRVTTQASANGDDASRVNLEGVGNAATEALALWMAGGDHSAARVRAKQAWDTFGALAARGAAPLDEVTKRCLCWRDVVSAVLRESAAIIGVEAEVLSEALAMTQTTLDVTLVRLCSSFEQQRAQTNRELESRQEELSFLATHDQLTGLPNRTLMLDRAEQMFARARRNQTPVAALFINIDNFTGINETFGCRVGDQLVQAVAARLDAVVRDADALGRMGPDEFVVLAEGVSLADGAELIAARLQEALRAPFDVCDEGEVELTVTASIGIATGDRACAEDLLRDADIAMQSAKAEGRNTYVVFESAMQDVIHARLALEMDLRGALQREEFFLVYQPTLDLSRMVPTGVETLLRWRRPGYGIVPPNDFVPLLEETGLISQVGNWVLQQACSQAAMWRAAGHAISVAVNVSGRQLDSDQLVDDVRRALAQSCLAAHALTLEITETALMRNAQATAVRLHTLKEIGVRIAIDDFGTGYSSLAHLQRFPVNSLKIDRSFVSHLSDNREAETLLATLVKLGKALSIETLAEGIEHEHELSLLQAQQCDSGQGYLFARPLDASATEDFLNDWPSEGAAVMARNTLRAGESLVARV
jgi:diguanylate cyclase (GGDEF)-like protein